tara:strand:- start:534 stop:1604 length:1071 start_codon:yes stop_codon:yes gene_type:complete
MIKVIKKSEKKEITTILGKDVHSIVRKHSDKEKFDEYRKQWELASKLKIVPKHPLQIDFELNYSCNFSCKMCTWSVENASNRGKKTWLDFSVYKKIIDDGVKNGLKSVRLNYINEPLIRKDIIKFINYAKDAGVLDVYFSTNGSLLSAKISNEILNSGLTRIQVSIDATTKDTFDKVRQGGDFDLVVKNTLNFIKLRNSSKKELPTMRVNFVRTKINEHELNDFINFWKDKSDCIGIQDLVSIMDVNKDSKSDKVFNCAQPFYHLTVRYDGTILPCCTFFGAKLPISRLKSETEISKEKNLNNIDLESLKLKTIKETWDSDEMKSLRKMHKDGNYQLNDICKECVLSTSNIDDDLY